jgi:DNA-binding winged helix-turn-helix (wHTH) protein/tetratricopeptide (TPR) repeat protein
MRYRFGEFVLDRQTGQLQGPDGLVTLRRQAWKLLVELLKAAPALVSRDDLLDRVWGRSALSPNALPQTVSELRQALGDSAREPRYIETAHGRGYRMVCAVTVEPDPVEASASDDAMSFGRAHHRTLYMVTAAVLLAGTAVLLISGDEDAGADQVRGESNSNAAMVEALQRQANTARERHDPAAAAAHLRALSLLDPGDASLMLDLAAAELDALQSEQARQTLSLLGSDAALRRQPHWLLLKARLAEIDGEIEQAVHLTEAAMSQAVALDEAELAFQSVQLLAALTQRSGDLTVASDVLSAGRALPLLAERDEDRARLALISAALLREQGQVDAARRELDALGSETLSEPLRRRADVERALLRGLDGQPEQAWTDLQALLEHLPEHPDPDLAIDLHNALGSVAVEVGKFDQALAAYEQAMSLARRSGRGQRVAGIQVNAGALMARQDRFGEAERLWQGALEVFEALGDRRGQAVVLGNLAAAASAQGLNQRSQDLNSQALVLFRELDLDGPRARTAFNLALVAAREGRLDAAEELLTEAYEGYRRVGQYDLMLHVGAVRVDHRVLAGDLLLAEALLLELEEVLERGSVLRRAAVHASAARLALWRGDLVGSRQAFEQARELRVESGHEAWVATSELELLQVDLLDGADPWQVRVAAAELAERFERRGQTRAAARSRLLMIEALLSEGETEQARAELTRLRRDAVQFNDVSLTLDLDWVEAWTARPEERVARLASLARKARDQGYVGKLARIEAGLDARGIAMELESYSLPDGGEASPLVVVLPPYVGGRE